MSMNTTAEGDVDLAACDREPIHVPEAIQPHGILFLLDAEEMTIRREAGPLVALTGRETWLGRPVEAVFGATLASRLKFIAGVEGDGFAGRWRGLNGLDYDLILRPMESGLVVEVEQSSQGAQLGVELIGRLDAASASLERASSVQAVCERAATVFRQLTGFDRVMIYQFRDDESGQVVAESRAPHLVESFQNHRFPASDIPRQARALYLRNRVRVIPDSAYQPQPLSPPSAGRPLDMSDCALRSVSPVHLQYLRNMGVRASASVSIVVDDELWGLVACHSASPQLLPFELRTAAANLGRSLGRQIKAKGESALYRERVRLRELEDELIGRLQVDRPLEAALAGHLGDLAAMVDADGVAVVAGDEVLRHGVTPADPAIRTMAGWVSDQPGLRPLASRALSVGRPEAEAWRTEASGLLGIHLQGDRPVTVLWFRAEIVETVRWAGDPSTAVKSGKAGQLTPRASFEAWTQTVHGQARRWSVAQIESAARLRDAFIDLGAMGQIQRLNRSLRDTLTARDVQIEQQGFLIREVNHRVQNSLTLVSSFLGLQARQADEAARVELLEARRRVRAVSMVHSRLYRGEVGAAIDLARYFEELVGDLGESMGSDWAAQMQANLAPVSLEASRAITVGLVLTELIINAQKYAYDGAPGPIAVKLEEVGPDFRLTVEDAGKGGHKVGEGFGSMMIRSLVGQLGGQLDYRDAAPGLKVVLKAPIALNG